LLAAVAVAIVAALPVWAEGDAHEGHDHHRHHAAAAATPITRSEANYQVPDLGLVRQDGSKASFPAELDDGRPVMLNFIYTSCTAICPVTTQVFRQVQDKLGGDTQKVHMVSISIDPEYDTPKRLADFAHKYGAGQQWTFYTGTTAASVAVQKAFEAYRGDKMNHTAITYLRPAPGKPWLRLDGMAAPDDLVAAYRRLMTNG
jgi:protein SCO1/2